MTLLFVCALVIDSFALQVDSLSTKVPDSISSVVSHAQWIVEISRTRPHSKRHFYLACGQKVWVTVTDEKGNTHWSRAIISKVSKHTVSFNPHNADYKDTTYLESGIAKIQFNSTGRAFLATAVNTGIVIVYVASVVVIVVLTAIEVVMIPFLLLSRSGPEWVGFGWVGEAFHELDEWIHLTIPFRRRINFADGKWRVQCIKAIKKQ